MTRGLDDAKSRFLERKQADCPNASGCLEQKDQHGFNIRDGVPAFSPLSCRVRPGLIRMHTGSEVTAKGLS